MPIKFTRQTDGTFLQTGDLPLGTRTVRLFIDGVKPLCGIPRRAKEYRQELEELLTHSVTRGNVYELQPVDVESPELIAKKTAQLVKARKAKKGE